MVYDSNSNTTHAFVSLAKFANENNLSEACLRDASVLKQKQHRGFFIKFADSDRILEQEYIDTIKVAEPKVKRTKKEIYKQPDERVYFYDNVKKIYDEYHIGKEMSCADISLLFNINAETVRLSFKKIGLTTLTFSKTKSGKMHPAYLSMTDNAKYFIDNFEQIFNHHYNILKEPISEISRQYDISITYINVLANNSGVEYKKHNVSSVHYMLSKWLNEQNIEHVNNDRKIISPKEIDIYIPSLHLGIEINGIFWHSEDKLGRSYHLDKLNLCESSDVNLMQFWDIEVTNKFDLVTSIIKNNVGNSHKIYARKTMIKNLKYSDVVEFLNSNHIQGTKTANINYGLYYGEDLVMVATFSKHKIYEYELSRLCTKIGNIVIGGAEKIMKQFFVDYNPNQLMSFCDKRLFRGNMYEKLGFKKIKDTTPNYWYFNNNGILESRIKYQKHKLKNKLKKYSENLSEYDNMLNNGYLRVFDCGSKMYLLKRK